VTKPHRSHTDPIGPTLHIGPHTDPIGHTDPTSVPRYIGPASAPYQFHTNPISGIPESLFKPALFLQPAREYAE
jgi:hypothetical protein